MQTDCYLYFYSEKLVNQLPSDNLQFVTLVMRKTIKQVSGKTTDIEFQYRMRFLIPKKPRADIGCI